VTGIFCFRSVLLLLFCGECLVALWMFNGVYRQCCDGGRGGAGVCGQFKYFFLTPLSQQLLSRTAVADNWLWKRYVASGIGYS
jgi:hypothetical protein